MNHVNEFILASKLTKENEITEKLKSQSTQSKALRKAKEIAATVLSSVFQRSGLKFFLFQRFFNLLFSLEILVIYWNFQKMLQQSFSLIFFLIFCMMVDDCNILKMAEPFFPGKFIFGQIQGKTAQNGLKIGFSGFFEKFCHLFFLEII